MGAFTFLDDEQTEKPSGSFTFLDDGAESGGGSVASTVKNYGLGLVAGAGEGVANTEAAIGTFLQAPAANTLSGVLGARALADRGITAAINAVSPGRANVNPEYQESAQMASRFAAETRAQNAKTGIGARVARALEEDGRYRAESIQGFNRENNPELIRQQQATAEAEGFVDNLKAIKDNPLAFANTMARSAPDMALGAGVAKKAAMGVAAAGGGKAAQIGAASTAGMLSEAGSSAMQTREGVYQQVVAIPLTKLTASPRYQEILASTKDPVMAREVLANELADQAPMLAGVGTGLGTVITNRIFGGDTTAKVLAGERTTVKDVAKNLAQESTEEGLQGSPEDLVQHGAVVQADPDKKLDVAGSLAQNMAAGAAMGGGGTLAVYGKQSYDDFRRGGPTEGPSSGDRAGPLPDNAPAAADILGVPETEQKPTAAEKALFEPKSLTALDRVEAIDTDLQTATPERATELIGERESITKSWPATIEGGETTFSTEAGARVGAKYALIEAGDLVTSHDENLRPSNVYPPELQPRERDRHASEMQVSGIVQKLDPARLGLSADAATGAPIIGADGLVESGNARSIALKRIYQANGQKAEDYKAFIRSNAAQFGIDPATVDTLQKPVLVRVRTTPVNRAEFARQANAATVAQMSPSEQARSDAARLDVLDDLRPTEDGDFSTSRDFIRRFMAKIPATEQASMLDSSGQLSQTGYARIRNAVLAKAYGDSPVLVRMVESMDDNLRNIGKALMQAAPEVAKIRQDVADGALFDADITPDLMAAVEELSVLRDSGRSIQDALAQAGMFGEKYSPETRELLQFLDENIRRPKQMAEFIRRYTEALRAAGNPNQGSLLGETAAPNKGDLLTAAKRGNDDAERPGSSQSAGAESRWQSETAQGHQGSAQSNEAQSEWVVYPRETGTLGIPRAEMPQVKGDARGALIQFLEARGITNKTVEDYPSDELKPTQAEFSTKKTEGWKDVKEGSDRSVLISSDGYILDGHHQWMAALAVKEPIKAIQFDAPIRELLAVVHQFPSAKRSTQSAADTERTKAREDFDAALAELGAFFRQLSPGVRMLTPEEKARLMPALVKLFEAGIREIGYNIKDLIAHVKKAMRARPELKPFWNHVDEATYREAATSAVDNTINGLAEPAGQGDLFSLPQRQAAQQDLFASMAPEAPKVAMIDGRPYDTLRDNFSLPATDSFVPAGVLDNARDQIRRLLKTAVPVEISAADRAKAERMLTPIIERANGSKAEYDQKIIDITKHVGALGQILAPVKTLESATRKLVNEVVFDTGRLYDMVRSTILIKGYGDAQSVLDAIRERFDIVPGRIKNMTDSEIDGRPGRFTESGYGQVLVNVNLQNGVIAEIQINIPEMVAVKMAEGHSLYEIERAEASGSKAKSDAVAAQREIYPLAAAAARGRANSATARKDSSLDGFEPKDNGKSRAGVEYNNPVDSSSPNTLPSGNLTNSVASPFVPNSQPSGNLSGTFISGTSKESIADRPEIGPSEFPNKTAIQIIEEVAKDRPFDDVKAVRAEAVKQVKAQTGKGIEKHSELQISMMRDDIVDAIHNGQYAGAQEYARTLPVRISASAISLSEATQAFNGTSFSPERRGRSAQRGAFLALLDLWRKLEKQYNAAPEDRRVAFVQAFNDTVDRYVGMTRAYLNSHSRVMSSMIVGPANFPVARQQKKSEAAYRRAQEANEFLAKAPARLLKVLRGPVDNSVQAAISEVEGKLAAREAAQARMKEINAAHGKFLKDPAILEKSPLPESDKKLIREYKPRYSWEPHPFAPYELTNNNAEIRRLRDRVEELKRRADDARAERDAGQEMADASVSVRMVKNVELNRLQLLFNEKPSDAVRADLKSNGFKWAPSNSAWQRQLTDNAVSSAERIIAKHYPKNSSADAGLTSDEITDKAPWGGVTKLSRSLRIAETIDVDGVERPAMNSNGQPIHPTEEGIRNFWRWHDGLQRERLDRARQRGGRYAGSKQADSGVSSRFLFDEQGRPRVFYHGTNADIVSFDLDHPEKWDHGWLGRGVYLGSDPELANFYARQKGGQSNAMPLYAGVTNPYVFTREEKKHLSSMSADAIRAITERAMDHGHDGGVLEFGDGSFELVAFKSAAVKSASGNSGDFDPRNPNVSLSRGAGSGMSLRDLKAVRDRVSERMTNLPPVNVLESPAHAPEELRDFIEKAGAWSDVEGAMHDGEIYLFASGLSGEERAEFVLATHEITHYGLRGRYGLGLDSVLQQIWLNNAAVRKAATALREKNGLGSNLEAVEEVLADMPSEALVKLKGWRKVVAQVRDWFDRHGFEKLTERLNRLLNAGLSEQQQADVLVADVVRQARGFVERGRRGSGKYGTGTRLANVPMSRKNADSDSPRLSRAGADDAEKRADAIIAKPAATARPIDAVVKALTKSVRVDRMTLWAYNKAGALIDRLVPEHVKAGVVSDYGVPEAVIDRRVTMQGAMRRQVRGAGELIDKLATLTRAESRIAYEWMNNTDPQAAEYFEKQLPPESLKVMGEVKTLIDQLSQEAVKLGQLDPEAFKRNRFEYLRRSYVKHTAELTKGEAEKRGRAISILGDQYKGRGMVDSVAMSKFRNAAPEWWGRKLQESQADKGLKGEKFARLERRAPVGEGTMPLEQKQGPGRVDPLKKGRLLEVVYWPVNEPVPAKMTTWEHAGTWEVRDTKGGDLVLWRDFTKQEREAMGEIDEARFAIAKTLHGMVHDVETGKYLEWLAVNHAQKDASQVTGKLVEATDRMRDTYGKDEWVQVPETTIAGTSVKKYGALAGRYLPGPIWNDVRQTVGFRFEPFGETYAAILGAWKTSKTALSPAVHTNNVMANMVMADWHDVTAGHIVKALRLVLAANDRKGEGAIGRAGNVVAKAGIADQEAARVILERFAESGGNIGTWATAELQKEQLEPLLKALENEMATIGRSQPAQVGAMVALQKALQLRFPSAWEAFKGTKAGKVLTTEARNMLDLYEAEDQVFRLAAWLRAKEEGATDLEAGKLARKSFLDYNINAPWIQAMRKTAFPFISFTYRAIPMLMETAAAKPWKLLKLGMLAGGLNMLGYLLSGGDEDDERRYLPEEKSGRVLGVVPKLIRMPWNDAHGSPVFLDIRRFVPVGDFLDAGQSHSAVPLIPSIVPGGVLSIMGELVLNKSQFTGKEITRDTDTATEKTLKVVDHLYKAFAPNLVILPGTYAFQGVVDAGRGKTDTFGREQSTPAAVASSFGIKLGSYPTDVLRQNAWRETQAKTMEIDRNITQLKRELQRNGIDQDEFREKVDAQMGKKRALMQKFRDR